jgi:hypothetical protein
MSRKSRTNINKDNVGRIFQDKEGDLYRLTSCEVEPRAIMAPIAGDHLQIVESAISKFSEFVMLKPVTSRKRKEVVVVKKERKPRQRKEKIVGSIEGVPVIEVETTNISSEGNKQ